MSKNNFTDLKNIFEEFLWELVVKLVIVSACDINSFGSS